MKIHQFLFQKNIKLGEISLAIALFFTLFSFPALAIDPQIKKQSDPAIESNSNTIIAGKKVRIDRNGRPYVLNRFRRRVYLYPKSPKNYNFQGKIKLDRNGRRYILKRNGQKFYL